MGTRRPGYQGTRQAGNLVPWILGRLRSPPMTEHHIYFVDAAHEGARLDAFLTAHLRAHSRSRIKAFIDAGHVTVDGTVAKPTLRLPRGQRVAVSCTPQPPSPSPPHKAPFPC